MTAFPTSRSARLVDSAFLDRLDKGGDEGIREVLVDLLSSEDLAHQYMAELGDPTQLLSNSSFKAKDQRIRGAMLFFIFGRLATSEGSSRNIIDIIVRDADFIRFLIIFYELPTHIALTHLVFHAAGTTSFIFRALSRNESVRALKVIQPPYVRIPSIRSATAAYRERFGFFTEHSPAVYDSGETWILMEFIEGQNLHEFMQRLRTRTSFMSEQYSNAIIKLFEMVMTALAYYEKNHIVHGDLTPFNIMVKADPRDRDGLTAETVKLIDFGPNYVLKDRVGSGGIFAKTFARTELFTAPEIVNGLDDPSRESDLYSVGMIGLDLLSDAPLRKDRIGIQLREIWDNPAGVGLAQIVEDLIDEKPENRALILKSSAGGEYFAPLRAILVDQINLYYELTSKNVKSSVFGSDFTPEVIRTVRKIWLILKVKGSPFKTASNTLLVASVINASFSFIIKFLFVAYTILDIQEKYHFKIPLVENLETLVAASPHHFVVGELWQNLPGRLVALTFGIIATAFYANIFSFLRVSGVKPSIQLITNGFLRAISFSYFLPIMIAIVYDPKWWPYCAAAGVFFPAFSNLCCWYCGNLAAKTSVNIFTIERDYHESHTAWFLDYFWEWSFLMFWYSFGILVIGLALTFGWAIDEPIYAYCVCIINIMKVYRNNCRRDAPVVSGNLARLFFSIRRLAVKQGIVLSS
jgi:serine/threonine protein kinase